MQSTNVRTLHYLENNYNLMAINSSNFDIFNKEKTLTFIFVCCVYIAVIFQYID